MNKLYILLISLFILFLSLTKAPETLPAFQEYFSMFLKREFQEKVYLHTDKSHYLAGEYIWFCAYRTDAATHIPSVYSRFVYVELYNSREERIERLKVLEQEGCFQGSLLLDSYLPEGRYCLRAYTYWMQNFDEAFYFQKEITIGSPRTHGIRTEIQWGKTNKGQDYAQIRIKDAEGKIFPGAFVDCRMYHDKEQIRKDIERVNNEGWVRYPLRQKDRVTGLRVQFLNKKPFEYQVTFKVPDLRHQQDVDLQFFPEGGDLVAGLPSRVSFKAVGTDGYGRDVYGSVCCKDGREVAGFTSSHLGMGSFELLPEAGESYYAVIRLPGGEEKRVDLPVVKEKGILLRAEVQDSVVRYACRGSKGYPVDRELYLLVHSRGVLLAVMPVVPGWSGKLALENVPPGIIHGVLIDHSGHIYSERLSFVYPKEKSPVEIKTDRTAYNFRDSVKLRVSFSGPDSLRCSVAVTDSLLAPSAQWGINIANYFLLTSDLKGHIEDPGWYFDPAIPYRYRQRMLELLLSTQGWTRFDIGRRCRNERDSLPFFLELSQGFSGRIKNFWGKGAKNSVLYVVVPRINFAKKISADPQGRFSLNLFFPDSTDFVFQALSARNRKWVELYMDEDSLRPPLNSLFLPERWIRKDTSEAYEADLPEEGDGQVKTMGYYYEGGRKIYILEEAKIVKKKVNTYLERYEDIAELILETRDIRDERIESLEDWILSIPGVGIEYIAGQKNVVYKRGKESIYLFVNDLDLISFFGSEETLLMLENLDIRHVDRVGYVIDCPIAGPKVGVGSNLTIFVYLKPGYSLYPAANRLDFVHFSPLGFHEPVAFYQPRYDVEQERLNPEPDERSTLYWIPQLRLGSGESRELKFYTTDREGPFQVVLEGITDRGEIVRSVFRLNQAKRGRDK